MTASTPDDLVVAFRSLDRREREAIGDADPDSVAAAVGDLHGRVADAAALLGVAPDAGSIAGAIESRALHAWDDMTLDALRSIALQIGHLLREIAALSEDEPD